MALSRVSPNPQARSIEAPAGPPSRATAPRPRALRPLERLGRREGSFEGRRFDAARARVLTPLDEVRALDAAVFVALPLPTVLELEVPGRSGPVWLRSAPGRGAAIDAPVIDGPTLRAITMAVASDRARPVDFQLLVEAIARDPNVDALGIVATWMDGVAPSPRPLRIGQVLERLGAKLFSVRVEDHEAVAEPAANGPVLAFAG